MQRDQAYGALIFLISLVIAILYAVAFFAPWLTLPFWWHEWAVGLPVLVFVLMVLVICGWIGWTMLRTPPPAPVEAEPAEAPGAQGPESKPNPQISTIGALTR